MKNIKAAIFDMDGVVVDNHKFHFEAWMAFAKKYNFPLDEKIYREKFNGKTNADLFTMIFGEENRDQFAKYAEEKEGMYQRLYLPHMQELKGLSDYLSFLQTKRIKIGLGTSAPGFNVDFVLNHLRLRKYFDVIVDGQEVGRGKPDPEVYLRVANKLGVAPVNCLVFEDSLAGLESGQRAGCHIIGVATSHRPNELKVMTDEIIFDFTEAKKYVQ